MDRLKVTNKLDPLVDDSELSLLSLAGENGDDRNLFNSIDQEIIKLSGSQILLFKYFHDDNFDEVYQESKQKAISGDGILLIGHYEPRAVEENLTEFGVEVQNDQVFIFNKSHVEQRIGRSIISGDILKPKFQNMKFEVFEVQEDSFEVYGIYHLMVHAKLLRDTQDIHNEVLFERTDNIGGKL